MKVKTCHTRTVKLAKVLLPLAALALLSTIFMISDRVDPNRAPIYSEVDVAQLAQDQRIGAPRYSGMTEEGDAVMVNALSAYPDVNGDGAKAQDITARLEAPDGTTADLTSTNGRITPDQTRIHLTDNVSIRTSTGYHLNTHSAEMATDQSRIIMPEMVSGTAPFGTLTAGQAEMLRPSADIPYHLVFTDGVKLVYQPH